MCTKKRPNGQKQEQECTRTARIQMRAFTLLELMIALAIVAVIAAFAFPSYRSQIARSHRTEAAAAIYRAAQFVEMQRQTPDTTTAATSGTSVITLPAGLDQAPQSGTAVYTLRVLPADESNGGYAIEANPVDTGPMRGDACGTFMLDATGRRANLSGSDATMPGVDECWGSR